MKPPILKLLILRYLKEKGHGTGYDFMKFSRDKGFPGSPGSVYPHLHELEKNGFVTHEKVGRRKVYTLTEGGKRYLEELEKTQSELLELYRRLGFVQVSKGMRCPDHKLMSIFKKSFTKLAQIDWKKPYRERVYWIIKELHDEIARWKDESDRGS